MSSSDNEAHVLYVDHQGHPAPLSMSYHATASRRLASAVDRHPPSTITEVDSAYCPQCLTFHDANSASNIGYCLKPTCRLCPLSNAVATVTVDETDLIYECGLSDWTSRSCHIHQSVPVDSEGKVEKEDLETACNNLGKDLAARSDQKEHQAEEYFKSMLSALETMAKEQMRGQRSAFYSSSFLTRRRDINDNQTWSVSSLEASLDARSEIVAASLANNVGGRPVESHSLEVEQALDPSLAGKPINSILLQPGKVQSLADLLPLRIPLRPRKSRRCRAELAEGRPGILLKPKLNPLEGDSSLRTGHGQWWKKDSSGIHVLPRMRIVSHGTDGSRRALLLRVANPTLGEIRLRLAASAYTGEQSWDAPNETNPVFKGLLVDSLTNAKIEAAMSTDAMKTLKSTEISQLERAEDSFLEFGKARNDDPEDVMDWKAEDALAGSDVSPASEKTSSIRLIALKSACAWYELVVVEPTVEGDATHAAIPLSLQIEVGNQSWDSSLIRSSALPGDDPDTVSIDILLAWKATKQ